MENSIDPTAFLKFKFAPTVGHSAMQCWHECGWLTWTLELMLRQLMQHCQPDTHVASHWNQVRAGSLAALSYFKIQAITKQF